MSQEKYIGMDVHPGHHLRRGEGCSGQADHGMPAGNQGGHDGCVHPRAAWNSVAEVRGRNLGCLVTRSPEAPREQAGGVRSAQECSMAGWEQE